jgi:hypothetical protein
MSEEAPREHSYEHDEPAFRCVDSQYMEIIEKMVFMVMSLSVTFSKKKIIELIKEKFKSSFSVFVDPALRDFFSFDIHYYNVEGTFVRQQFTGIYKAQDIENLIGKIIIFIEECILKQKTFDELHGYIQVTVNDYERFQELEIKSGHIVLPDGSIRDNIVGYTVGYTVGYGQKLSQLFFHYFEQLFLSRSDIDFFTSHTRPFFSLEILDIKVLHQKICEVLNPLNGQTGMGCGINVLYSLDLIDENKWAREIQEVNRNPNGPGTTFRDMLAFFNNVDFINKNVGLPLWGNYNFRDMYVLHSFEYKFDTTTPANLGFFFDFLKKCMSKNSGVIARHNRHIHLQPNIAGHWVIIYKDNNGDIYTYDPSLTGFYKFNDEITKKYFDAYRGQNYVSVSIMNFTAEIVEKEFQPGNFVGGSIHSKNSKSTAATGSLSTTATDYLSTTATDSLSSVSGSSLSSVSANSLSNNPANSLSTVAKDSLSSVSGSSLSSVSGSSQQDHYYIQQTPSENDRKIEKFFQTKLKAYIDTRASTPQNKVESFDGLNQPSIENSKIINSRMSSNNSKKRGGKGKKNRNRKSKRKTRKARTRRGKR